ncbi:MAG: transporter substrate-binding domain-containing protein [Flexilinea sp.]|nr:transporter substrate-binding domain-containing protein [Flexilinea sp.]
MARFSPKRFIFLFLTFFILPVCMVLTASAQDNEESYVENDWNYVEGSMDISGGIPVNAMGVLESILNTGKLRVATEPYFPPQEFIDPSKSGQEAFVGPDMELARLIAKRMGVTLEIVPMDFSEVLTAVTEGQCDLAISALAYMPSRAMTVELSKGYYFSDEDSGNGVLIRTKDQDTYRSVEDFSTAVIAAQSASLQEYIAAENFLNYKEFIRLNSTQDVYEALKSGKVDGAVVDVETAETYITNEADGSVMLVPEIRFSLDEHLKGDRIAAKKGQIQLLYFVNAVIDEVLDSGQYMEWYREADELAQSLGL